MERWKIFHIITELHQNSFHLVIIKLSKSFDGNLIVKLVVQRRVQEVNQIQSRRRPMAELKVNL